MIQAEKHPAHKSQGVAVSGLRIARPENGSTRAIASRLANRGVDRNTTAEAKMIGINPAGVEFFKRQIALGVPRSRPELPPT